jgi:hypothetical protein
MQLIELAKLAPGTDSETKMIPPVKPAETTSSMTESHIAISCLAMKTVAIVTPVLRDARIR